MQIVLEKRLTVSEKGRHWIIIPAKFRRLFPAVDVIFDLQAGGESFSTYVDSYSRLRLGSQVFNEIELEEPEIVVIIQKASDQVYVLSKKKR